MERVDVAAVGGGQAGLATSAHRSGAGIEPVVFERARLGQTWRDRWDRKSSLLLGVGEDTGIVASTIAGSLGSR